MSTPFLGLVVALVSRAVCLPAGVQAMTVLFKHFNVLILVLALAGFVLIRDGRARAGGPFVALSLCLKPIAVLMVLAGVMLLVTWPSRRSGARADDPGGRHHETLKHSYDVMAPAQFAQYVLFLIAYAWLRSRPPEPSGPAAAR